MTEGIAATVTVAYVGLVGGFIVIEVRRLATGAADIPLPAGWRESVIPVARNRASRRLLVAADATAAEDICRTLVDELGPDVQCVTMAERTAADYFSVVLADCRAGDAMLAGLERECSSPRCSLVLYAGDEASESVVQAAKRYKGVVVDTEHPGVLALAVLRGFDQSKMTVQVRFLKTFSWLLISSLPLIVYFSLFFGDIVR